MTFEAKEKIINYPNCRNQIYEQCRGKETILICSRSFLNRHKYDEELKPLLEASFIKYESNFSSNPSIKEIINIAEKYQESNIENLIGLGGGSAMDVAKVISVLIPAKRKKIELSSLLKNIHLLDDISPIYCIQAPTTAGTGSEVTQFAAIWDYGISKKYSLSTPKMLADKVFIDSDFLRGIPYEIALSTGLDALNQSLESIWNINRTDESVEYAINGACLSLKNLSEIEKLNEHEHIRQSFMEASLNSGRAINITRTSICHAISYPLTLEFGIPHGLACAFSMLPVLQFNEREVEEHLEKIQSVVGHSVVDIISALFEKEDLSYLFQEFIPSRDSILNLLDKMTTKGRFDNNIRHCSRPDLERILLKACEQFSIQ